MCIKSHLICMKLSNCFVTQSLICTATRPNFDGKYQELNYCTVITGFISYHLGYQVYSRVLNVYNPGVASSSLTFGILTVNFSTGTRSFCVQ